MRMVTIEPGGVFGPIHDHKDRPGIVYILQGRSPTIETESRRTRAGMGSPEEGTPPMAREQRNDSGGGDLGRHRQARVGLTRGDHEISKHHRLAPA